MLTTDPVTLENAPDLRSSIKLTYGLIDQYCASFGSAVPAAITLDIDDTVDVVHGRQQLSLFNAHEGEYVFKPIHVYDVSTGRPVVVILRPGKTPSGKEVRGWVRRMVRQIRKHWPTTHITLRGDGHSARPEVMVWAERKGVDYIFGLAGSKPLLTTSVSFGPNRTPRPCAATPKSVMEPNPGAVSAALSPALKPHRSASTVASS